MLNLNFPKYPLTVKSKENKNFIFDIVRKKNIILTPEEWVRQHCLHFLINEKKYPNSLIAVEKQFKVETRSKRFDILIFDKYGKPKIIVECKAPNIKISQETFDQIARYNLKLNAKFLMVTNGLDHYYCKMDHEAGKYEFLKDLPTYEK